MHSVFKFCLDGAKSRVEPGRHGSSCARKRVVYDPETRRIHSKTHRLSPGLRTAGSSSGAEVDKSERQLFSERPLKTCCFQEQFFYVF